ncbi:MAG: type II secretion system protein [Hydrogenophaga sp.]|uniref:type II secretion system protein n=1 Tax=Hydrogenophaga sp. TaxID=1904254 RepID=UPI003D107BB8
MKSKFRFVERGFSLLEMSMVLVIIGVLLGAVMVGTDVLRQAKNQQLFSVFISGWRDAFSRYTQVIGVVPGDNPTTPNNMIGVALNTWLCDTPPNNDLSNVLLAARIRIPQGRGLGRESRYVYQDSLGTPHELQVCFATINWSVQGAAVGLFASSPRHVMRLTGLTTELALQLDVLIDGSVSARFGQFRLVTFENSLIAADAGWGDLESVPGQQESARNLVTAYFEML